MNEFPVLVPATQLSFFERLKAAERSHLLPALLDQAGRLDIGRLDQQLLDYAGKEKLAHVARYGLRGELLYPVPCVLEAKPTLLGYYRLLLGFSQKEFYKAPFTRFKRIENDGVISMTTRPLVEPLCRSLIQSSWILVNGLPALSEQTLHSLTLLTLGPQLRGSRNVNLGVDAIRMVYALIRTIVADRIQSEGDSYFVIQSVAGRSYRIEFSPDPDIAIRSIMADGRTRNRIAIEVKGGTDFSNVHNRLGEAEKSHQKAKSEGFTEFWTVINTSGVDPAKWRQETPTTTELFYLEEISDVSKVGYTHFREYLVSELGI